MNESLNSTSHNEQRTSLLADKLNRVKFTKWKISKFSKIDKSLKDIRDKWIEFNKDTKSKLLK